MKKFLLVLALAIGVAWVVGKMKNINATTDPGRPGSVEATTRTPDFTPSAEPEYPRTANTSATFDSDKLLDVKMPRKTPSQIKQYTGFTVSFNKKTHNPNWVAWELTAEKARGKGKRDGSFWTDETVKGCPTLADYRNTGYDRGHMAPAGDMKWSKQAMFDCFSLANMAPQAKALNSGAWNTLEQKTRERAKADGVVYVVTGPVPGEEPLAHIGLTGVNVPRRFFKVILSPYGDSPQAIGFIMPNSYVEGGMQPYAMSVDEVEKITGYDFFSALPDDLENSLESNSNFTKWSRLKR